MLNKIIPILIALFLINLSCFAQDEERLYTRAGFKIGLNYANVSGDLDSDARTRLHLGAVLEFPLNYKTFIQVEALYSAQGYTIGSGDAENDISLNYLALPIIGKYEFAKGFSIETGPRFATLASVTDSENTDTDEFYDSFSDFDFGWDIGLGYKFESGMFFQARYTFGLSDINNIQGSNSSFNTSLAQLSIGYLFKTRNNRRPFDEQQGN
ncbi:porin family protein [Aquimarina brevivitae]|uniref:Outer membrane protein with beta-barrel domain n=1 Tax=Aquimarina brevivitae TaxID=323412 RepID=A0A4Q7P326_9FLAO|nr:porin family protein [Aquimarina brevivitae]RZS93768.1 outer membrane protein with beta-barrel domain [Aquimarina brevivitae]